MNAGGAARSSGPVPGLGEKRAFLESGAAWPGEPPPVCIETHGSLVFLTRDRAYKLKKPARMPHADMRSLAARRRLCEEELRLNLELAGDTYRRTVPLTLTQGGSLALAGEGTIVDWLIEMKRLPDHAMLDQRIVNGPPPSDAEIAAVGACLIAFYSSRIPSRDAGRVFHERLGREFATDIAHLREMQEWLGPTEVEEVAARVPAWLETARPEIEDRAAAGLVVEGHGDLRAEHVCLERPPVIFDRVEFDHDFRLVDPYAEITALDLDCLRLGAEGIGRALHRQLAAAGLASPSPRLATLYRVLRCLTQARLAIDHLRDPHPRTPEKWAPRARWFIAAARVEPGRAENRA